MKTKTPKAPSVGPLPAPVQTPAMREAVPPDALTMAAICAGPAAPVGLCADERVQAADMLANSRDMLNCGVTQIAALRVAVLKLVPVWEHTAGLPTDVRYGLRAARVLLEQTMHFQVDQLRDDVGQELGELAQLLKGGTA